MLLAEGSKHCCQVAWANAAEQQSHGWASHARTAPHHTTPHHRVCGPRFPRVIGSAHHPTEQQGPTPASVWLSAVSA